MSAISVTERATNWDVTGIAGAFERTSTESGERLVDLIEATPVLLIFLRHAGCTFCREAIADIAKVSDEIESNGTRIILVHMGDREGIAKLAKRHKLEDVDRICDPNQELYSAFGLKKGSWRQLFGPKVWARSIIAAIGRGHGLSRPSADHTQMPGVFFVDRGLIISAYRHRSAADRPCYTSLCVTDEMGGDS